jgi:5-methylcytosine-specific restriction endonuclease McrA
LFLKTKAKTTGGKCGREQIVMSGLLNKASVLVLNKNWQAINVRSPAEAFCQMATDVATGLDIDGEVMVPVRWADWIKLPIREQDQAVSTSRGLIRIPTVTVLARFSQVPKKRPKLSSRTIWERDGGICQYTGKALAPHEGNIDHILPRSRGGKTTWENCVLVDRKVNSKKGDRLPEEVGLRLLRKPVIPREVPVSMFIRNHHGIRDWDYFLERTNPVVSR